MNLERDARLCGPDCAYPDLEHRAPEPDWIGDYPVMHGESDYLVPDSGNWFGTDSYCLCGHPDYLTCPGWYGGGPGTLGDMTIYRADGMTP